MSRVHFLFAVSRTDSVSAPVSCRVDIGTTGWLAESELPSYQGTENNFFAKMIEKHFLLDVKGDQDLHYFDSSLYMD